LKDESFIQPKIADAVAEIGDHLNINVRTIKSFLRYNPIQIDGEAHKARRKSFLNEFNNRCKDSGETFKRLAEESLDSFAKNDLKCLTSALIEPYVDSVLQSIVGSYDKAAADLYGDVRGQGHVIFEYFHSPNSLEKKSRQAEQFVGSMAAAAGDDLQSASNERELFLLSYILQGRDPLVGGLCAFMHSLLEINDADRFGYICKTTPKELFWHSSPVNYIGRVATKSKIVDGITITPGDYVLLMLPWANHDKDCTSKDSVAFGYGPHICAGQALALTIAEAWLSAVKEHYQCIDWHGIKPGTVVPAVFRLYKD
jgi:cytochrome P450